MDARTSQLQTCADYRILFIGGRWRRIGCGRWRRCIPCARARAAKVRQQVSREPWRISVTLTMPTELGAPTVENLRKQARSWERFIGRLRRRFKKPFGFFWVREGAEGRLHLHALLTIPFIKQADLSEMATRSGFGAVVYVQAISDGAARITTVGYMTKTLSRVKTEPAGNWPNRTRRYQFRWPK